ncbi:MAG: hypothetical protein Q9179_000747 [Wetmoreana sp. 5 TL-2023]
MPFALPSVSTIPNAESTIRLLQTTGSASLLTVPLLLEEICQAPNDVGIRALQPLQYVACGGGPMKTGVAEVLSSKGVRLLNHCGATEIGALAPIFNPPSDYDWHYFVLRQDLNLRLEDVPQKPGCMKLVGRAPGWDEDFVMQDFLRPNPKAPETQFQFLGRADDLIVLANGEKVRCTSLEATVESDPRVTGAIAFGEGRDHLGLIVEAAPNVKLDCSNVEQVASFREAIWPLVEKGNEDIDSHGAVSKDMIIVASPLSQPLQRTAKGSLAKEEIYRSFRTEIDAVYSKFETTNVEPLPSMEDTFELENYISRAISGVLGLSRTAEPIGVDEDIFELGMNSLQAARLSNVLASALRKTQIAEVVESPLSKDFIYSHPTIFSLRRALTATAVDHNRLTMNDKPSRTDVMMKAVSKHCRVIEAMTPEVLQPRPGNGRQPEGRTVIVTGSTGNLGSNLVHSLAQDPSVSLVYCLNRPSLVGQSDEADRQHRAFTKAGICLPTHLWSKLRLIEVRPRQANFGLSPEIYAELRKASYIVHNAWPMDFNRSLVSFEAQLEYLDSIIQLALRNTSNEPPRLLFTSSIASVARYPSKMHTRLVPESRLDDPDVTAPFGYPEAKWVCEQMLLRGAQLHHARFEPIIVRVGQLVGSTTAASWSPTEHLPAIFKSSQSLGALPDISGTLCWIPLDIAAASLLEILFQPHTPPTSPVYHLENPVRQSWPDMLAALSRILSRSPFPTPSSSPSTSSASSSPPPSSSKTDHATTTAKDALPLIPFTAWLQKVRAEPDLDRNPAGRLIGFLEESFMQLGTGALVLDTKEARGVSRTLREVGAVVDEALLQRYIDFWKADGVML